MRVSAHTLGAELQSLEVFCGAPHTAVDEFSHTGASLISFWSSATPWAWAHYLYPRRRFSR